MPSGWNSTMVAAFICAASTKFAASAVSFSRATVSSSFQKSCHVILCSQQVRASSTTTTTIDGCGNLSKLILSSSSAVEEEVDPGEIEGTELRVLKYPHPALRARNVEITPEELDNGSVSKLAKEMFLVMYATGGVGLAAPQVGVNKRLLVYNESGDSKKWLQEVVMVNPKIVEFSEGVDVEIEGCLSFPAMRGEVQRSKWIKVEAQSLKGKKMKKKFTQWEARIFQHEYDHLDGILYPDRMTEEEKLKTQPRLNELIREFGSGGSP